ncbi:hypothetical protein GCM10022221_22460 [Actinocorallia aurea]
MALIGLVRVSTDRQKTQRQHDALAPICWRVFEEPGSSPNRHQPQPATARIRSDPPRGPYRALADIDEQATNPA